MYINFMLIYMGDYTDECLARCGADGACAGFMWYRRSLRCKGLSSLGAGPVPTSIHAESWSRQQGVGESGPAPGRATVGKGTRTLWHRGGGP